MTTPITTSFDTFVSRSSFLAGLTWIEAESDEIYKRLVDVKGKDVSPLVDGVQTHDISGIGPVKKRAETTPFEYDAPTPGNTKTSYYEQYALAAFFTELLIMRGKYQIIEKVAAGLGKGYNLARNLQVAGVYDDAFTGTLLTGPDGQPLLSASHTTPNSGVVRTNILSTASSMGYTSAQALLTVMKRQKTPRGYPMPAIKSGQSIQVVISPEMEFEAYKIFNNETRLDPTTNHNAINAMRHGNHTYEVISNPYFTSTSNWFYVNPEKKGLWLVDEQPLTTDSFRDPYTKGMRYDVRASWLLHPEAWEFIYGSNG